MSRGSGKHRFRTYSYNLVIHHDLYRKEGANTNERCPNLGTRVNFDTEGLSRYVISFQMDCIIAIFEGEGERF